MRKLVILTLVAACELKPPPDQQEPARAPVETAKPVEAPPPGPPAAAAGSAAPRAAISPECLQVGAKIAQVFIDSATDEAQRITYERERANMTRKTGEACTSQGWSEEARTCYLGTKSPAEIKACELKFTPPPAQPPAPSANQPGTVR